MYHGYNNNNNNNNNTTSSGSATVFAWSFSSLAVNHSLGVWPVIIAVLLSIMQLAQRALYAACPSKFVTRKSDILPSACDSPDPPPPISRVIEHHFVEGMCED